VEECNKFLELLGDVVEQGKNIFILIVVQALYECTAFL
jgi:hypothetical protein